MYLTEKQRGVLADLFSGRFTVQEVLEKRKVTRRTYYRWHAQEYFAAEFKRLLELTRNEYQLIFAHYAPDIAMKLVTLTTADKDETARKACMDVIANHDRKIKHKSENESNAIEEPLIDLSPEVASKMLALLAEEKRASDRKRMSNVKCPMSNDEVTPE
jgi:predicted DNA-binding protein YlxM (UPF0122 family)